MTNHEVEAKRSLMMCLAFLRSGGKVTYSARRIPRCDLTITEARKLIKARALSAGGGISTQPSIFPSADVIGLSAVINSAPAERRARPVF